jgi:hypothetical protein
VSLLVVLGGALLVLWQRVEAVERSGPTPYFPALDYWSTDERSDDAFDGGGPSTQDPMNPPRSAQQTLQSLPAAGALPSPLNRGVVLGIEPPDGAGEFMGYGQSRADWLQQTIFFSVRGTTGPRVANYYRKGLAQLGYIGSDLKVTQHREPTGVISEGFRFAGPSGADRPEMIWLRVSPMTADPSRTDPAESRPSLRVMLRLEYAANDSGEP